MRWADGSTREFRTNPHLSNPVHQWPDPNYRLNTSSELRHDEIAEIRNLNATTPDWRRATSPRCVLRHLQLFIQTGRSTSSMTRYEAGAESVKLVNTPVVHENAMPRLLRCDELCHQQPCP